MGKNDNMPGMRILKVTPRTLDVFPVPPKAICCGRNVRVGQWVGRHKTSTVDHTFVHVHCMRELAAGIPEDDADPTTKAEQFERDRRLFTELAAANS